jgi:hypothetical protein
MRCVLELAFEGNTNIFAEVHNFPAQPVDDEKSTKKDSLMHAVRGALITMLGIVARTEIFTAIVELISSFPNFAIKIFVGIIAFKIYCLLLAQLIRSPTPRINVFIDVISITAEFNHLQTVVSTPRNDKILEHSKLSGKLALFVATERVTDTPELKEFKEAYLKIGAGMI